MVQDPSQNSNSSPKNPRIVKIGEASRILGLHKDTLRRWEKSGKLTPIRTPGGTRLYSLDEIKSLNPVKDEDLSGVTTNLIPENKAPEPVINNPVTEEIKSPVLNQKSGFGLLGFLLISTTIFLLLSTLGVLNIKITEAENSSPTVLSETIQTTPKPTVIKEESPEPTEIKEATSEAKLVATPSGVLFDPETKATHSATINIKPN